MLIDCIAELCILAYWIQIPRLWIFAPMMRYCGDGKRRAVRARPDNVRAPKAFQNILRRDDHDIRVPIDMVKVFIPLNGIHLMPAPLECLADASRPRKKL
jgi:hypothetical protein